MDEEGEGDVEGHHHLIISALLELKEDLLDPTRKRNRIYLFYYLD